MTLGQKQRLFTRLVGLLIAKAYEMGYELSFGEAYRTKEQAALYAEAGRGISNSLHCSRLAIDLNLFKDGKYLRSTESHRPLGEWWEGLHDLTAWGGNFKDSQGRPKPDGNHYSVTHGGRA